MPRSPKPQSSPETSLDTHEIRRRVVRACQRCRLKKCKCDGATPCTRCKSDDAICAYGKHKKSDKTIFRSGYVQMLERQHAQLIAGLQELYRRTQDGGGWTGPRLVIENHNQPLTHKILEALGVLHPDEWEDTGIVKGNWQVSGEQGQDENRWMFSGTSSPSSQPALSPISPTWTAFPQSEIMSKRRLKLQTSLAPTAQTLSMPPPLMASFACIKPELYNHTGSTQTPAPSDAFPSYEQMKTGLGRASCSTMDWSFGMDDLLGNLGGQEQLTQGC